MLVVDLKNPVHVKLEEPILQSTVRAAESKCWRGGCDMERLDNTLCVTIPNHLASDHGELVAAEIRCHGGRRMGGAAGVVIRNRSTGVAGAAGSALTGLRVGGESGSYLCSGHGDGPDPVAVETARRAGRHGCYFVDGRLGRAR
uniref:Uncharacterized protein n=1 Tax=Triticum urartu TaxID=4572 RepID=A0A8R7PKK8_TRIUA